LIADGGENRNVEVRPATLCLGISDKPCRNSSSSLTNRTKVNSLFSKKLTPVDIQERVADSVNNIVKYFLKDSDENMTVLLCGKDGFCQSVQLVFQYGYKCNRLFSKKLFVWDYLERVCESVMDLSLSHIRNNESVKQSYLSTVHHINTSASAVGKEQKFQLFICLGLREQYLQQWLELMYSSPITTQMYESCAFFRDQTLMNFLITLLEALTEFDVVLDKSITRGI
jgi:hypothetical protein